MPGLNIIVASADGKRFCGALETALVSAALGQQVRMFLQGDAVAMLRAPAGFAGDAALRRAGQPVLAERLEEAARAGIEIIACQSGMVLAGLTHDRIVPNVKAGGLVSFMAPIDATDRLLVY